MRTARWLVATLILALGLGHAVVFAQVTTADLVGRVTDNKWRGPSWCHGDRHADRHGRHAHETTSDTGDYAFNLLPIGPYEIKLELQGFKTQVSSVDIVGGATRAFRWPTRTRVGERDDPGHR